MYYSTDEMFLSNTIGTFDWNAEKELTFKDTLLTQDDIDARLIDVLGNLNKLQEAIALADEAEGRNISKQKLKSRIEGARFAIPVNGDKNNLAIFEIKRSEDIARTGFNGSVIKCIFGGGDYNGKTIVWADGSKGWGNLFKIQSPVMFLKTVRELWNDWIVNDFWQIGRGNSFYQLDDLVNFIQKYNEDNKKNPITMGIGASMIGYRYVCRRIC